MRSIGDSNFKCSRQQVGRRYPRLVLAIMKLLDLAPNIQEALLFLPGASVGRDAVNEREMGAVCGLIDWRVQSGSSESCVGARRTK